MAEFVPTPVTTKETASNKIIPGKWSIKYKTDGGKIRWLVIHLERVTVGVGILAASTYTYTAYVYAESGESISVEKLGSDVVSYALGSTQGLRDSTAQKFDTYKKAQALLEDRATNNPLDGNPDNVLNNTPIPTSELDGVQWNPPPHQITRPPSFYTLANIGSNAVIPSTAKSAEILKALSGNINKLGKIYQNKSSAVALNKLGKGVTEANVKTNALWGFRFTYNPTRIAYGSTIDTAIDWMLQPKDPSNFFGGNTVITFDLYLNRIADMNALKKASSLKQVYGRDLTPEEKNGILKRGTEYDLEFLYRVVNGAPGETTLVSDTSLKTSDFGYITGMPTWIQFHDNMRYRGSLSSIQVEHVIFTEQMIPMLSVVKLAFIRYPELDKLSKKAKKAIQAQQGLVTNANSSETTDK